MSEPGTIPLAAFQHADSFFPSGAVSFSWGLETMSNQGLVSSRHDLRRFIRAQLTNRWAVFERPVMIHAHTAADDWQRLAALDWRVDAQTLAAEQRDGSRRMGAALLAIHVKLETPDAAACLSRVRDGLAAGHLPVVQGLVWQRLGFDALLIQRMAAHALCTGLLSAALRLAIVGHFDAQRILAELHPVIEDLVGRTIAEPGTVHNFVPQTDIASMNYETDEMRLFAN